MSDSFHEYWHYHSEAEVKRMPGSQPGPAGVEPLAIAYSLAGTGGQFDVVYATEKLIPNHQITLVTEAAGWSREIFGVYWDKAWRFRLPASLFQNGGSFRLKLDGELEAGEHHFDMPVDQYLNEGDANFPEVPYRFTHHYENLRVSEDQQQQNVFPPIPADDLDWDVIIIGSGMGGGTLADALTDQPGIRARVLVLEAGSLEYDTHIDNKPLAAYGRSISGHEVRNYDTTWGTSFGLYPQMTFGGRSLFWSGLIPRMKDWELANWPNEVANDLRSTLYDQAERLMRKHVTNGEYQDKVIADIAAAFPDFEVVDTPRSLHQPEFSGPGGRSPESFLYRSTGTYSSAELLLDSLRSWNDPGRGHLFVQCNHLVTRLNTENGRVTGVVCEDLLGNRQRVFRAKYVVLAAGSLESARLALASKLEPQHLIGRGLTDHPSYYAPNNDNFVLKPDSPYAGRKRHAKIFLYPKQMWENHWFNVEIVINGDYWNSRHADQDVEDADHRMDWPSSVNFKFIFGSPLINDNWVRLDDEKGRLTLNVPPNPFGEEARPAVKSLLEKLMNMLGVEPRNLDDDRSLHFGNGGTVNHAGGTLRMGSCGQDRVVDSNLKFDHYDNLYACDPSVYPYIPAANPSLTLAALAIRLAGHLAGRLNGPDLASADDAAAAPATPAPEPAAAVLV